MHTRNTPLTPRRSSRVPLAIPILVTSLEPGTHFSGVCETLVVNAHGCAMRSPVKFQTGIPLHFHSKDGRQTTAQVVFCQPDGQNWRLGARLERPENFWGLASCPHDWAALSAMPTLQTVPGTLVTTPQRSRPVPTPLSSEVVSDNSARQAAAEYIKSIVADSVRPLQAEVMALKERLARADGNRSRFEVSLTSIPPELEQQLESRLRNELEPRVLNEARQQSTHLLTAAKRTIDQRTAEAGEDFRRRMAEEFQVFEQRAEEMSAHISDNMREHLRGGLAEFHERLVEGGNRLKNLSEELLEFLKHRLHDEHNGRCRELEQVRGVVESESSRLREQIEYLDSRITTLYESACRLESGVEKRLGQMASCALENTRSQLESLANATLQDLTTRNAQALGNQTREACEGMKLVEKEIMRSVSEALKVQAGEILQGFEHSIEEMAKHSLERCRHGLATALNAAVKSLGEQFQLQAELGKEE